jgi:ribosomal protein L22
VATVPQDRQVVRAQAKWVRMPARKARLVTDHIRGRSVPEARTVLAFTPRAAAREIEKVLRSAVANAEANNGLQGDDLVVLRAYVDEGPTMKRWRARARGRVARIHKRTCHITIELAQGEATTTESHVAPAKGPRRSLRPRRPVLEAAAGVAEAISPTEPHVEAEAPAEPEPETPAEPEAAAEPETEETPAETTESEE